MAFRVETERPVGFSNILHWANATPNTINYVPIFTTDLLVYLSTIISGSGSGSGLIFKSYLIKKAFNIVVPYKLVMTEEIAPHSKCL